MTFILICSIPLNSIQAETEEQEIKIVLDNTPQKYSTAPIIIEGTTLVPMRDLFESLDAHVEWHESTRTAFATKDDQHIEIKIGSYFAKLNDETIQLPVKPRIVDSYTMIPLRLISEVFGAKVEWEANSKTIYIETGSNLSSDTVETNNQQDSHIDVEETEKEQTFAGLTYTEAVERALKRSKKLKSEIESIKRTEEMRERVYESNQFFYSVPTGFGYSEADAMARQSLLNLVNLDIGVRAVEKQVSMTEEAIAFEVMQAMDEILQLQVQQEMIEQQLSLLKEQLKLTRLQTENGIESKFNLNNMIKTVEEKEKERELLNKALDEAYLRLNNLIGSPEDERLSIAENVEYTELEQIELESYIRRHTVENPHIWLQEQEVKKAQHALDLYTFSPSSVESYEVKKIDLNTQTIRLADLKEKLDESIRKKYNQIRSLETRYEALEINLEKAQQALELTRAQFDAGMVLNLQLKEAELAVNSIKSEMHNLAIQHKHLKILFNKPYLAPDYLS